MAEPSDMMLRLLRDSRGEIGALPDRMDKRFDLLESAQASFRHVLSADTLLSKLVRGEFQERIELLERKVRGLEGLK
jgi:hypothetical protein